MRIIQPTTSISLKRVYDRIQALAFIDERPDDWDRAIGVLAETQQEISRCDS